MDAPHAASQNEVVPLVNHNAAWKSAPAPAQARPTRATRPLDADPDDLGGALAARRELGVDAEQALIEGFLDRVGQAIDARVDERVAQHRVNMRWQPEPDRRRGTGPKLALAICSLALGIPPTGIAAAMEGFPGLVLILVCWSAIVAINVSFHRSLNR
jgi:hypothetical protein